jgi:hypothetical protein
MTILSTAAVNNYSLTAARLLSFCMKLFALKRDLIPGDWHDAFDRLSSQAATFNRAFDYKAAILRIWYLVLQQETPAAAPETRLVVSWFWVAYSYNDDGALKDPQYLTGPIAAVIHLAKLIALSSALENRYASETIPR